MKTAQGADLGQGPDFSIEWPVFTGGGQVILPRSRFGHDLKAFGIPLNYNGPYPQGDWTFYNPITNEAYAVPVDVYGITVPPEYGTSAWSVDVFDATSGDVAPSVYVANGTMVSDLAEWHAPMTLLLKISATRWNNSLEIRAANGQSIGIAKHQVQGDWSWNPASAQSWFNSYGFFDASGSALAGIPWVLYDNTRGQVLSGSVSDPSDFTGATDDTNSDTDSLPDWYERMIGTNPLLADTDGDGVNDDAEITAGTNPRAVLVTVGSNATLSVFTPLE